MLEPFFKIYDYLVANVNPPIRRKLMDEIDWNARLIAIKGGRGVGKTDFVLARAKEVEAADQAEWDKLMQRSRRKRVRPRTCLYINLNNFYFTEHTLVEFAGKFVKQGGKTLFIDQTFKYPGWSKELRRCHDRYKDLHIVFVASPVMRLIEDNRDLAPIVKMYNLRG